MEEIKVGEYIRTDKGIIDKVIQIVNEGSGVRFLGETLEDTIIITNGDILSERRINKREIEKHSLNIIDLIEVGDYVNGEKVIDTWNSNRIETHKSNFDEEEIKSIVTKEQFSNIEYRLED